MKFLFLSISLLALSVFAKTTSKTCIATETIKTGHGEKIVTSYTGLFSKDPPNW